MQIYFLLLCYIQLTLAIWTPVSFNLGKKNSKLFHSCFFIVKYKKKYFKKDKLFHSWFPTPSPFSLFFLPGTPVIWISELLGMSFFLPLVFFISLSLLNFIGNFIFIFQVFCWVFHFCYNFQELIIIFFSVSCCFKDVTQVILQLHNIHIPGKPSILQKTH